MPPLDCGELAQIGMLQALDDAIAFRSGRLQRPCLDCTGRHRCTEHAFDQYLLEAYKTRHTSARADVLAELDLDHTGTLMQASGEPPTAAILGAAVTAWLREAAARGPVVVELDRDPVVIELSGPALAGYPLPPVGTRASRNAPAADT